MEKSLNDSSSSNGSEDMKENINNDNNNDNNKGNEENKCNLHSTRSLIEKNLIESVSKMEDVTKEKLDLAEKINFKNNTDKLVETDEFGFLKSQDEKGNENNNNNKGQKRSKDSKITKEELLKINARTEKWQYMLEHYKTYQSIKRFKLKSRTRKGIPDNLRSYVWQLFVGKDKLVIKGLFEKLDKEPINKNSELSIIKDLDRTYPLCQLFKEKYGKGQRNLFRVLSNYSKYNKNIGYVQGLGYLAALFLIYMDEESAFYMLHAVIKNYEMEGLYLPGFPDLKKKFYVLLNLEKKFIPEIYNILKRDEALPSFYASEWFMCLFCKNLKPNILVRIIDVFLYEGYKVIYRFAIAFLKMKENDFIKNPSGIFYSSVTLKKLFENIEVEELFKEAFDLNLSKKHIDKFQEEYEENKDTPNNEFMNLAV